MRCSEKREGCEKPENPTGKPENRSPEQIRACHGVAATRPCVETTGCEHPERLKGRRSAQTTDAAREFAEARSAAIFRRRAGEAGLTSFEVVGEGALAADDPNAGIGSGCDS